MTKTIESLMRARDEGPTGRIAPLLVCGLAIVCALLLAGCEQDEPDDLWGTWFGWSHGVMLELRLRDNDIAQFTIGDADYIIGSWRDEGERMYAEFPTEAGTLRLDMTVSGNTMTGTMIDATGQRSEVTLSRLDVGPVNVAGPLSFGPAVEE
jgi:hypothetical protein